MTAGDFNALLPRLMQEAGAVAWGVARAGDTDGRDAAIYDAWLGAGRHAQMQYMERHSRVRRNPLRLLDPCGSGGGRDVSPGDGCVAWQGSVISAAFPYYNGDLAGAPLRWARYSVGDDYHDVLRRRLQPVADAIAGVGEGHLARVCVDTAPLRERYWAVRAGVGSVGRNGLLAVPGYGSWVVIGTVVTSLVLPETGTGVAGLSCGECNRCVEACPGGALYGDGSVDARRCRSYLSIEHRGELPCSLGERVYGCDICQEVCPRNAAAGPEGCLEEFEPRPGVLALTHGDILAMGQEDFSRLFARSAIKRAKLAGLQRNARGK